MFACDPDPVFLSPRAGYFSPSDVSQIQTSYAYVFAIKDSVFGTAASWVPSGGGASQRYYIILPMVWRFQEQHCNPHECSSPLSIRDEVSGKLETAAAYNALCQYTIANLRAPSTHEQVKECRRGRMSNESDRPIIGQSRPSGLLR